LGAYLWTFVDRDDVAVPAVSRFVEPLPAGRTLPVGSDDPLRRSAVAVSPNGRTIAYSAAEGGEFRIFRRFLDLPTGHLTFVRQHTLWAVPFDLDRMEVRGAPIPGYRTKRAEATDVGRLEPLSCGVVS
jgi:hypothetical protein